uniref:Uncharacterized protein n=1 Tax=Schistosoma curassoni TaxID=6186 RepID=A0A183KWI8_9TREM
MDVLAVVVGVMIVDFKFDNGLLLLIQIKPVLLAILDVSKETLPLGLVNDELGRKEVFLNSENDLFNSILNKLDILVGIDCINLSKSSRVILTDCVIFDRL